MSAKSSDQYLPAFNGGFWEAVNAFYPAKPTVFLRDM
jgi:hypothetical protein